MRSARSLRAWSANRPSHSFHSGVDRMLVTADRTPETSAFGAALGSTLLFGLAMAAGLTGDAPQRDRRPGARAALPNCITVGTRRQPIGCRLLPRPSPGQAEKIRGHTLEIQLT